MDLYSPVLLACAKLSALEQGKEMHEEIIKRGFECDVVVGNTLVAETECCLLDYNDQRICREWDR